ncbi:MAG: hypothetical protein AAGA66_12665 [Bacteroidota bacterium]
MNKIITLSILTFLAQSCSQNKLEKKGFQVNEIRENEAGEKIIGLAFDSLELATRPRSVLLTKHSDHRLVPIYKINYDKNGKPYSGSNNFHRNWRPSEPGNNWNNNYLPGFEALYGYNLINVSHYTNETQTQNEFFTKPVLIKTLYYPAFSNDTLNFKLVVRDYYMVSVYDEDTNKDGYVNARDLRRLYLFDLNGKRIKNLVPTHHSVMSSEYDPANDFMYVFTKVDQNVNGQMEEEEPTHIFWIDLKDPKKSGLQYKPR